MAHSLERRWAKLVTSYERLRVFYEKSLAREQLLIEEVRDARIELRELRRDRKEYERASKGTFERLLATSRYAISHLHSSGDLIAAEKMEIWLEDMEENMQPVANVTHLIELLEEWCNSMPCDDADQVAVVWMKSKAVIEAARGTNGPTEASE